MRYELPTELQIGGQSYTITKKGDFRMVLDCFSYLEDEELSKEDRIVGCLLNFYDATTRDEPETLQVFGNNLEDAVNKMFQFINCEDDAIGENRSNHVLVDWDKDSQLICAAVNKVAGQEVRSIPYLHWWTFMGYYMGIGESLFSTVISIRDKIVNGKKLEKHESKFRRENPQYFIWNQKTIEQREADDWLKGVWNAN